jgi:hypothetical protein
MAPASRPQVEAWLAELSVRVIPRAGDAARDALTLRVYADALARYPLDVVKAAIFNGWRFWPALDAELLPRCEERAEPRRAMLRALMAWAPPQLKAETVEEPEPKPRATDFVKRVPKDVDAALTRINAALGIHTGPREVQPFHPEPMTDDTLLALLRNRVAAGMMPAMPDAEAFRAAHNIPRP